MNLPPPEQAVILAGGRGTRLGELTQNLPKPMVRFAGKPFLEHLIEMISSQGLRKILLLTGYFGDQIRDYFGNGASWNLEISYSQAPVETEIGARLTLAKPMIEDRFVLLYCDNYLPWDFAAMWAAYATAPVPAMITVYTNEDNFTRHNLRLGTDSFIELYDKKRQAEGLSGVDIGFAIMEKSVLELIPPGNSPFEPIAYPALVANRQMRGWPVRHRYYSVGDTARLPITETFFARQPTILLDRDGVLNRKAARGEYVRTPEEFIWLSGAREALALLKRHAYRVILITNQAGIGRGIMTAQDVEAVHQRLRHETLEAGGEIADIFCCPHHWEDDCTCRKPKPGMFFDAQRRYHLDLSRCLYVGDDERDEQAAHAAGCRYRSVDAKTNLLEIISQKLNLAHP